MKPRIIVCGLGHTGHKIFCWLRQQGAIVVGISDRPIRSETSEVVVGNLQAASTLLAAGIQKAHTLVIAGNDDAVNLAVLMQAMILKNIKLFTVMMMLVGAGIIGICYALLNDYVLGTRFSEYWDIARVPQRHHYIICGLGGLGIQIAKELHTNGYDIVIIEQDPNSRFLNTARSMQIPVIQGSASLPATLEAANVKQAAALLAVTSSDMSNLEIALTAKGLEPKLSVIVRNQNSHFALMVQQVFEFEGVLNPTELAAPAFAAAAIGGRILGNGMTAESLWVSLGTLITPKHPFCGHRIQDAAKSADFVPLYVETNCQTIHGWDLLNCCLSAGDVLYLTMPANCLDQLWRTTSELIKT